MRGPQTHSRHIGGVMAAALFITGLSGCEPTQEAPSQEGPEAVTQAPVPEAVEEDLNQNSILRSDMDARPIAEPPLEPLEAVIPFAGGGNELDPEATRLIDEVIETEQFRKGGEIVLRGHTDSSGHDEVNIRASRRRAEAVRDRLVEAGASEDRITIIAMGEQNPIAPNATPSGEPDEEGRARNRRVAVTITPPSGSDGSLETGQESDLPEVEIPDIQTD